jgi:hypothetical protein
VMPLWTSVSLKVQDVLLLKIVQTSLEP